MAEPLTQSRLKEVLDYDPESHDFLWKIRTSRCVKVGGFAGSLKRNKSTFYREIGIDGQTYLASRLVWLWMTGSFPPDGRGVEHIDGNGLHNRWSNLRLTKNWTRETMTLAAASELIAFDPETNKFTWKDTRNGNVKIGAVAGGIIRSKRTSYRAITLCGKRYSEHRLVWLFKTGEFPPEGLETAHDDQNGLNNKFSNLSIKSNQGNHMNRRRPTNNTSGVMGICRIKRSQKWVARIQIQGKSINLGLFPDKNDAIAARRAAEKRYGFHPLHGS